MKQTEITANNVISAGRSGTRTRKDSQKSIQHRPQSPIWP
jgi:hypothetical protein